MSTVPTNDEQLRAEVSARYASTALQVLGTEQPTAADACCVPTCCTPTTSASGQSKTALPVVGTEPAQTAACCATSCCSADTRDGSVITSDLYSQAELGAIPMAAALASLGCGNARTVQWLIHYDPQPPYGGIDYQHMKLLPRVIRGMSNLRAPFSTRKPRQLTRLGR